MIVPHVLKLHLIAKFQFIASEFDGRPPADARKFIRSHVMRGKNTALKRSATTLSTAQSTQDVDSPVIPLAKRSLSKRNWKASRREDEDSEVADVLTEWQALPPAPPHDLSLYKYAQEANPTALYLIHRCMLPFSAKTLGLQIATKSAC